MGVPVVYRKSSFNQAQYDLFDSILGVSYQNFYPKIGYTGGTTVQYNLVTNTAFASDTKVYRVGVDSDLDFDIEVEEPFIIAPRECVITWTQDAGAGDNINITWTIYHVDSGGTETSLGSVLGNESENVTEIKSSTVVLTRKAFKRGEKLRVNANIDVTGSTAQTYFDPAGSEPLTDTNGRAASSRTTVSIPIVRDL